MAAVGSCCKCGECHVTDNSCDACAKCIPRYICVTATPADYNECLKPFTFRLQLQCGGDTKVWSGSKQISDELTISATVVLYKVTDEYGQVSCYTTAQGSGAPGEYDGTLPAGMSEFFLVNEGTYNEVSYTLTFSIGGGSVNPKVRRQCPSCVCASCLPIAMCLQLEIPAYTVVGFPCGATSRSITLDFDCDEQAWTGAPITANGVEFTARIALENDFCGATFTLTGGASTYTKTFYFEGLTKLCDDPALSNGFSCKEEVPDSSPLEYTTVSKTNAALGCVTESEYSVIFSDSGSLRDYSDNLVASFALSERFCAGACEPSASTVCIRACPTLDERALMCSPISLYASILEDDCEHSPTLFTFQQTGSYAAASLSFPSGACQRYGMAQQNLQCDQGFGYVIEMHLYYLTNTACPDNETDMNGYRLRVRVGGVPCDFAGEPTMDVVLSPEPGAVCESFQLDFVVPILGSCSLIPCCYGKDIDTMIIRVTL